MNIRTWKARYYIEMRLMYDWLMNPETSFEMLTDETPEIIQAIFGRDHIRYFEYMLSNVYKNHYLDREEKNLFIINRSSYVEGFVSTIVKLRNKRGSGLAFSEAVNDPEFGQSVQNTFKCVGGYQEFEEDFLHLYHTSLDKQSS